ncbi:MAG: S4 domain-containing protein, partial [Firmicutes bacterium]|nr:S4 domain-containing protein [Bacillota bacterium]
MKEIFEVIEGYTGQRLDYYLANCTSFSRTRIQKLIEEKNVLLNGACARASQKLKSGDRIEIEVPPPEDSAAAGEEIPMDIIYEDNDIIVVNKPRGIVVHPAAGVKSGTSISILS